MKKIIWESLGFIREREKMNKYQGAVCGGGLGDKLNCLRFQNSLLKN